MSGVNGSEPQVDQPAPLPKAVMTCRGEMADFVAECVAGVINPVNIVIVYQGADGQFGFRSNAEGSAAMQTFILECAKAVIVSRAIGGKPRTQVDS